VGRCALATVQNASVSSEISKELVFAACIIFIFES